MSKYVKSIEVNLLQLLNKHCILVEDEVSIFNKFNDSRFSHSEKTKEKSFIFEVSKKDILIEVNFLQL